VGDKRFGKYVLRRRLGLGGMAEVFLAQAADGPLKGREIALKRLLPQLAADPVHVDMFLAEADLSRMFDHPNIVKVFETGAVDDTYYIAMELIVGVDLSELLGVCRSAGKSRPVAIACHLVAQVARGLDYAHNLKGPSGRPLGVVHCDVTPGNIFLNERGEVRLMDFGVAQNEIGVGPEESAVAGKAHYMAPEQIKQQPLSPATDVFGLGAILYELVTLQAAFSGPNVEKIWDKIIAGKLTKPSQLRRDVPANLEEVILTSLSPVLAGSSGSLKRTMGRLLPTREERYADANALLSALSPICEAHPAQRAQLVALCAAVRARTTVKDQTA